LAWWHTSVILVLKRLSQEDHEFETSLGYTVRCCLKIEKKRRKERREGGGEDGKKGTKRKKLSNEMSRGAFKCLAYS
jgi:hypothetical protein